MTKAEINDEISRLIGIRPPHISTGSTESKDLFKAINQILGLGIDRRESKPELARHICESAGVAWDPSCESRGSTVTRNGMSQVLQAVRIFLS
jgi:hypothetical protein